MRGLVALLTVLLLAPLAAAQAVPAIQASVGALPVAKPLRDHVEAPFTLDVSCLEASADAQPLRVSAWIAQAPTWAKAVASPASFELDPKACGGPRTTFQGVVSVAVDDHAPAWTPAPVVLGAAVEAVQGNESTTATTNLTAGWFSILDVSVHEAVATVPPGGAHAFPVSVVNHGNDKTRVRFEVADATSWIKVDPVPDVVLESAQQGGSLTKQDVPITVHALGGSALSSRVGTVTIRVLGAEERAPSAQGDTAVISFVVTERGAVTPAASPWWVLLVVGAVALVRRRA